MARLAVDWDTLELDTNFAWLDLKAERWHHHSGPAVWMSAIRNITARSSSPQ